MLSVRFVTVFLTLSITHGFLFGGSQVAHPALSNFPKTQQGTLLDVRLEIGTPKDQSRLLLDGLGLKLLMDPQQQKKKTGVLKMPGAHGPHPKLSSGVNALHVSKKPSFIGMNGFKEVDLQDGCWEVIWRENAVAGSLICGFNVEDVQRNDNSPTLKKGRLYITFPVWTKDDLDLYQEKKQKAQDKAMAFRLEKEKQLGLYGKESNLFKKAMHYRNAAVAMEQYELTGVTMYNKVPVGSDVIEMNEGLLLTTKGTVWTKDDGFFGADHTLLGSAEARPQQIDTSGLAP